MPPDTEEEKLNYRRENSWEELEQLNCRDLNECIEVKRGILQSLKDDKTSKIKEILSLQGLIKEECK